MAKKPKKRKYSKGAAKKVERAMKKRKAGTLRSGRSGRKVKSRKQAIAIGLSEARKRGSQEQEEKEILRRRLGRIRSRARRHPFVKLVSTGVVERPGPAMQDFPCAPHPAI